MASLANYGTVVAQNFWGRMIFNKETEGTLTVKNAAASGNSKLKL